MTPAVAMILPPAALAAAAFALPSGRLRPLILPLAGAGHLAMLLRVLAAPAGPAAGRWLHLDDPARLVLALVSVLFAAVSVHAVGYLRHETHRDNRVFCSCMLLFLSTMTLLVWSQHWGLMWVALEATTLVSAPLIYFDRTALSLEATWKYLLVCSVGIALALLGTFFLAYSALAVHASPGLLVTELLAEAPRLSRPWLEAAFVLLLVGYGTKAGLAPMHTWLPDAHGEAPAPVSALLSGALLPCAFLPVLRASHLCAAAGSGALSRGILIGAGLLSIAVGAVFVLRQRDLKRMLAFSSVEQMGIVALGTGIGGPALLGALLTMLASGLGKGLLFMAAGNVALAYGSKATGDVSGILRRVPLSGWLFVTGFFAITGSPPFGPFVGELSILREAFESGRFMTAALFLILLLAVFAGMGGTVLAVAQGEPSRPLRPGGYRDGVLTGAPMLALLALVLALGTWMPGPVAELLHGAARSLEAAP